MFGFNSTLDTLWNVQRAMEQAMGEDYFSPYTSASAVPKINLFKDGERSLVTVELPGVKKADLKIEVKGANLRISGERKTTLSEGTSVHRQERPDYKFDRTITLANEIDPDSVKAELNDGILAISLSPTEAHKPKEIVIA